ncbi:MAG: DUF3592 domain-containing protein [Planctomycetaceae bacterium]
MNRLIPIWIPVFFLVAKVAVAGVDFSQTSITSDLQNVPAGTVVTVKVVLRNTGETASESADVRVRFPHNGFLIRIDNLPELKRDDNEREVTAVVSVPAEGEFRFSFDLLASLQEAQHTLSAAIEVRDFQADARLDKEFSTMITSAPSTDGVVIGGLRFYPAAFWLLGWLIFGAFFFLWVQARLQWIREHPKAVLMPAELHRMPAIGLVGLIMVPLAFLMVAAGLAWRDLQSLTSWKEASATILDRREVIRTGSRQETGRPRQTSTTRTPEFALKYQAGDREIISSGFDTGTSLHVGGQVLGKSEMNEWVTGKTIKCWYNPSNPAIVVVRRGFGGAYLFYLIVLPILWFGLRQLRKLIRVRADFDE